MSVLIHYPPTTNPAVRDLLDGAADFTRTKFNHFVSKYHVRKGIIAGEQSRVAEMGTELESRASQLEQTRRDAARFGHRPFKETIDSTGTVLRIDTGLIENLERQYGELVEVRTALVENGTKFEPYLEKINQLGARYGVFDLIANNTTWTPPADADRYEAARQEVQKVYSLEFERKQQFGAPRPKDEAMVLAEQAVDEMGVPPLALLDGFRRGGSLDHRNRSTFQVNDAAINWPTQHIPSDYGGATVADSVKILAWLFPDQMKARLRDYIMTQYDDAKALPIDGRIERIDALDDAISAQKYIAEAAIYSCELAGAKAPKRPDSWDAFVLLDCHAGRAEKPAVTDTKVQPNFG